MTINALRSTNLTSTDFETNIGHNQHRAGPHFVKSFGSSGDVVFDDYSSIPSDDVHLNDEEDQFRNMSPQQAPDGGYGWFVVLGCFAAHVVFGGLDRSEGVFFLMLTAQFRQSAQLTSWPGAIASTLQMLLGPAASVILTRYSVRVSVMIGAILMSLGLLLNSFAHNIYFYFISHSLIGGLGRGLAYVPGLIIVGMYFDKRAGLATGFATSGSGIGTFVIVPLSQYLADIYGFQGTFLILGGFSCHMFIAAMLYRPLSIHYRSIKTINRRQTKCTIGPKDLINKDVSRKLAASNVCVTANTEHTYDPVSYSTKRNHVLPLKLQNTNSSSEFTNHQISLGKKKVNCSCSLMASSSICFPIEQSSKQTVNVFRLSLLKNVPFLLYCVSIFMFTMAFRAAFTFIPALIESKGIRNSDSALVLSAAGAVDTFGRIVTGFVLDLPRIRPFRLLLYNLVIFGVSFVAFLLPLLSTFVSFCAMSCMYGLLTGAYISQKSVILADILDGQEVASYLGILLVFQGLGSLLGPPLSATLKDCFGSFDESFYFGGGLMIFAGILMTLCNICYIFQKSRQMYN